MVIREREREREREARTLSMQRRTGQGDTHMWICRCFCGASVLLEEAERGDRRQERKAGERGRQPEMDGWRGGREMQRDARGEGGGQWEGWVVRVNIYIAVWYAQEWKRERERESEGPAERGRYRASIPLLILFRTAKFSIQHVSPVMERGRGEETRERERGREREVDGC